MTHDIHADVKQDAGIMAMHADAERFDPRTEEVFKILQVGGCTAPALGGSTWAPLAAESALPQFATETPVLCIACVCSRMMSAQLEINVDCNRTLRLADLFVNVSANLSSCSVRF
jgi:hypothetical protein